MDGSPELLRRIKEEIRRSGPIPFSRFMERCLYDARHGYYTSSAARLGVRNDYFTASDVGTGFGRCMARQIAEMDEILGRPDRFSIEEFGAGRGLLARDILDAMPELGGDLSRRLRYTVVERSPALRASARRLVPEARVVAPDRCGRGHVGCVVAVELFDALPVDRVRRRDGRLREVFVGLDAGSNLVEREQDPERDVLEMASRYGAAREEGHEAEVATAVPVLFDAVQSSLHRGFVLIVDYGHPASMLYGGSYPRGTLLAYHRHATNEEFLHRVGEQDLTAHVNFTAIEDRARERGLALVGRTTQDRFLIANGLIGTFQPREEDRPHDPARVRERLCNLQLIHPLGMGRRFQVLVLSKGVTPVPALRGLVDPFA
jgi:SAM-dependent MidA family methyltransferase